MCIRDRLQVLDDGRLTDNQGRTVNFKNTIIIMTSNLGSHLIQDRLEAFDEDNVETFMGELRQQMHDLLRKTIRPEFLNRIDEIVLFKPCLLYTSPSPRDRTRSRMPSSA